MAQTQKVQGRRTERVVDEDHQVQLWSTFIDCYSSTSTRKEVNKFLLGLLGVRLDAEDQSAA